MKKCVILGVVAVSFLCTGCVQYWYQEGKTFRQCQQDSRDCFGELEKRTDFIGNSDYEFEYMTRCMQEKGYRPVKEKELPLEAKRAQPESSLHWRMKGIAGEVE